MTVLVLLVGPAPADAGPDSGANAALKYWQAFATLPGFKAAEKAKLKAECLTMPLDAQARGSVTSAKYALDMMRRGAKLPRCIVQSATLITRNRPHFRNIPGLDVEFWD